MASFYPVTMACVDPHAILGVPEGVDERELTAAYRAQAKLWHPDRGGGEEAARRMAEINAAYDLLRAGIAHAHAHAARPAKRRSGRGSWLPEPIRRALGPELLEALAQSETVRLVTPASTWASPRAVLAVTERRLLWLLDDAPVGRVRQLPFRDVASVSLRVRRRGATLSLRTTGGRRYSFADLRPPTAAVIERHLRDAR
jgi:curved DNA-binding protein CbpA